GGLPITDLPMPGKNAERVAGPYPAGLTSLAITRQDVYWSLLAAAIAAGAEFEPRIVVRGALVDEQSNRPSVRGVLAAAGGKERAIRSPVTIAADGRRSTLAFGLRLARHPVHPQRWALGGYFAGVGGLTALGGLLLAGDAAGFIDPVTGDGLRFAVRGGELAATAALEALEHGWSGVHARLADRRRREFGAKFRFNRALRVLVGSPRGLEAARFGARFAPGVFRRMISKAGDCDVARLF